MYHYSSNQQNNQNTNNNGLAFKFQTYSEDFLSKANASIDENKVPPLKNKTEKGQYHWDKEQHRLFLEGLKKYGKGNWKKIAEHVGTRNPGQVASHAQKYFLRIKESADLSKKRKRRSNFDINLDINNSWDGSFHPLLYRDNISSPPPHPHVEKQPIVEQILQQLQQAQEMSCFNFLLNIVE
uniref:MYB family transcription factor n=1 Tax=Melilotus albus TaxID=47082 RepID=A0A896W2C7_MELAB|nr:MYB family transcription factor [Melilotus albus]